MPRVLRWVGYAAAASLLLALASAAAVYAMSERVVRARHVITAPEFTTPLPTNSASLAEGERIAWTRGCQGCHGAQLEGKVFFSEPRIATLVAPNLTRLVPTRSDAELERALRHGLRPDGTTLLSMPSEMLRSLTDDDVARLIAWLRTQAPVDGSDGGRFVGPLGRVGLVGGQFRTSRYYIETETPLPPPTEPALTLGHYIATSTCTECHGNAMQGVDGSPALPPIVQAYARNEFAEFLRTGTAKGGRELPMMSPVARGRFAPYPSRVTSAKSSWLQIRVTEAEKDALRQRAQSAGSDLSAYVQSRALGPSPSELDAHIRAMRQHPDTHFAYVAYAEFEDFLLALPASRAAVLALKPADFDALNAWQQNLVAAKIELRAALYGVQPPAWTLDVPPLAEPYFAGGLVSLRPHLLVTSPVPFRRRNLFVEQGLGARLTPLAPAATPAEARLLAEAFQGTARAVQRLRVAEEFPRAGADLTLGAVRIRQLLEALDGELAASDAKGFLAPRGAFDPYLEREHLRVYVARADYLLAMKCLAMRVGPEARDVDDVRFLARYLGVSSADAAMDVVERFFPVSRISPRIRFALEELLGGT